MPRSIMTPNGLIFIQDTNIDVEPSSFVNVVNNGPILITDRNIAPRTIIRTQPSYSDVNNDPDLRRRVVKYYHDKIEVWLYGSYKDFGGYVVENDDNVSLSRGEVTMNPNKARFLMKNIIRKSVVLTIIDKFVRRNNVNWFDLKEKHHSNLKKFIHTKLKNYLRKNVD